MDYGGIVRRALNIAWHHRWLWLLALLAGESSGGFSFNYRYSTGRSGTARPPQVGSFGEAMAAVQDWVAAHAALLVVGLLALVVAGVVLFVLSAVAEGAAVRGAAELDGERPCGLGRAWGLGRAVFWPMLRLRLLVVLVSLLALGAAVVLLGGAILAGAVAHQAGLAVLLGWQWAGLLGLLLAAALVLPTLLKLAARAIALEGAPAVGSLGTAVRLLQRRLGPVALLWVIELACTIGAGLGFLVLVVALGLPAAIGGYQAFVHGAYGALVLVGVYALLLLALVVVAGAAASAFFSAYWTVGYRRLTAA